MNRRQLNTSTQYWSADRVCVSPLHQLAVVPCNLCEADQQGTLFTVNHGVLGFAERLVWPGPGDTPPATVQPVARRSVSKMMEIQPWGARFDSSTFTPVSTDCRLRY